MMLKIAYLGERFHGFARQPGLRTVEGDLLQVLESLGFYTKIHSASRTDKGVSALGNVIRVDFRKDSICRMLTASLEDIWVTGYQNSEWNPRLCTKHYTYILPGTYDTQRLEKCCQMFSGIHNFSAFTKSQGTQRNATREIHVSYKVIPGLVYLNFQGRSFLWQMIRRCTTSIKDYLEGKKTESDIAALFEGSSTPKPSPAPAQNLLLKDVVYDISFTTDQYSLQKMHQDMGGLLESYRVKESIAAEFLRD